MPLIKPVVVGVNNLEKLAERTKRLCPELADKYDGEWGEGADWKIAFTGWKVWIDGVGTCCPVERHDRGYFGQCFVCLEDQIMAFLYLPSMDFYLCKAGYNLPTVITADSRGVLAGNIDITDDNLRSMVQMGFQAVSNVVQQINDESFKQWREMWHWQWNHDHKPAQVA